MRLYQILLAVLLSSCFALFSGTTFAAYPYSNFTWLHPHTHDAKDAMDYIQEIGGLKLEDYQIVNLLLAKTIAEKLYPGDAKQTPKEAHDYMLMVMSIMWQESKAGRFGPVGDLKNPFGERSYGLMQVKRRTADKMLRLHPSVAKTFFADLDPPDEETIAALIYNPDFNITIACLYLNYLHTKYRLSWANTITAYNRGYDGAEKTHFRRRSYTKEVIKHQRAMTHIGASEPR